MRIVTAGEDRLVRVWDATTGTDLAMLKGHTGSVSDVPYSPDGARIVSVSVDKTVCIWDANTGAEVFTLRGNMCCVYSVSFSPDGARFVPASDNTKV